MSTVITPPKPWRNVVRHVTTTLAGEHEQSAPYCDDPALFTKPVLVRGVWRDAAYGMQRRIVTGEGVSHNLRTTMGRDQWVRSRLFGDPGLTGLVGTATAVATVPPWTLTDSGAAFPTATSAAGNTGLQGHYVIVGPNASGVGSQVFGIILSNTGTVLTVDQWYAVPVTGAAGTTPNGTGKYMVMPAMGLGAWIGVCCTGGTGTPPAGGHTPAASDVLRTADGLFGDGTTSGAATEQNVTGLVRTFVSPTFPAAGQVQFQNTWTWTGSTTKNIDVVVLCNSKNGAGSLLILEAQLDKTAVVVNSGDTAQVTWQVNP